MRYCHRLFVAVQVTLTGGLLHLNGCRDESEMSRRSYTGYGESDQGDTMPGDDIPDTLKSPEPLPDAGGPTTVNVQKPVEYATDLRLHANCRSDPFEVAVAAKHTPVLCENIVATAVRRTDDDEYEVGIPFLWEVNDSTVADLSCLNGPHDDLCWPTTKRDIFDDQLDTEPFSDLRVCTMNTCPEPRPDDCADFVCDTIPIVSVLNLEGAWSLISDTSAEETILDLLQDGRDLQDVHALLAAGTVQNDVISFVIPPYLYTGVVEPNRIQMHGQVWHYVSMLQQGNWSAERLILP